MSHTRHMASNILTFITEPSSSLQYCRSVRVVVFTFTHTQAELPFGTTYTSPRTHMVHFLHVQGEVLQNTHVVHFLYIPNIYAKSGPRTKAHPPLFK